MASGNRLERAVQERDRQHLQLVLDDTEVPQVQLISIDNMSAKAPALYRLLMPPVPQQVEAMWIVLAGRRWSPSVEPRWLLEPGRLDHFNVGHDREESDRSRSRYGRDTARQRRCAQRSTGPRPHAEGLRPRPTS